MSGRVEVNSSKKAMQSHKVMGLSCHSSPFDQINCSQADMVSDIIRALLETGLQRDLIALA